jgi:exosome complex RNA-binding protein Rrp42 (RNase PH superfamily)
MRYDLDRVRQLCKEVGLCIGTSSPDELAIELAESVRMTFRNAVQDENCLVGFNGTPWHTHGDFIFVDGHGNYVETDYLDVIAGLADGRILVCELLR